MIHYITILKVKLSTKKKNYENYVCNSIHEKPLILINDHRRKFSFDLDSFQNNLFSKDFRKRSVFFSKSNEIQGKIYRRNVSRLRLLQKRNPQDKIEIPMPKYGKG